VVIRGSWTCCRGSTLLLPLSQRRIALGRRSFSLAHAMGRITTQNGMGGMDGRGMGGGDMGFVINGQSFEPDRINTRGQLEGREDWLIVNDDVMENPSHLHVNILQVISRAGRPASQRRWKDTFLVKAGEEVLLRVTFQDFPGRTVYHCHNLDHEDLGLMGVLQIDGKAG
jgi:FtsP/CotA-like multicopper oxidase with cupredoxin domain